MHKTQPRDTQAALNAFVAHKAEFDSQIARLQTLSAEHFNVSPYEVHWGYVGDLTRYTELLKQITDAAFKEGEYAE